MDTTIASNTPILCWFSWIRVVGFPLKLEHHRLSKAMWTMYPHLYRWTESSNHVYVYIYIYVCVCPRDINHIWACLKPMGFTDVFGIILGTTHPWLVVSTILKNLKVSWDDDYSQYMEK